MANGIFTLRQQIQGLIRKAWPISQATPFVEYLVVAGGGGAGGYMSGGGAGGLVAGLLPITTGTPYTVTIGGGGAQPSGTGSQGGNGGVSVFSSITAIGGGGGGGTNPNTFGLVGGSGGGGVSNSSFSASSLGGQGTFNQGNMGGYGCTDAAIFTNGGGGGGAGQIAQGATPGACGNGGNGVASAISGTLTAYAGGGGGGSDSNSRGYGIGGAGGGGRGDYNGGSGSSGTVNTGGGGGGGAVQSFSGGSGIVIISYPDIYSAPASFGGANSPTASTSGSGSIYYPNAGGTGPTAGATFIQFSNTTALQTGTTATYEAWVYPTVFTTNHRIMSQQGSNSGIEIYYDSSGNVAAGYTSGGANASVSSSPLSLNTWYHIAVVFTSGTMTVYFNGVSKTLSGTTTGYNFTSTNPLFVGSYSNANQYGIIGYLSNVRIVKGVAVYTGNFTAPTAPFQPTQSAGTNISAITGTQTSLLLNSVSGAFLTDSSTNGYNPAAVSTGSAAPTWNQASPFATGLGYKNRVYTWTGSGTVTF